MSFTKLSLLFLITPLLAGFVISKQTGTHPEKEKWLISSSSTLRVNGSTNVSKFACDIAEYDKTDTLIIYKKSNQNIILSGTINLNVLSFNCHNAMMTKDLRKTLKQQQFPQLHINFLSLNELPDLSTKPQSITGFVDIELAGVHKQVEVNYQVSLDAQKVIHLLGTRAVNFSDFNLVPPKRLGGMVQAKDEIGVAFHLKMKAI